MTKLLKIEIGAEALTLSADDWRCAAAEIERAIAGHPPGAVRLADGRQIRVTHTPGPRSATTGSRAVEVLTGAAAAPKRMVDARQTHRADF
jgi:hypothetical protein